MVNEVLHGERAAESVGVSHLVASDCQSTQCVDTAELMPLRNAEEDMDEDTRRARSRAISRGRTARLNAGNSKRCAGRHNGKNENPEERDAWQTDRWETQKLTSRGKVDKDRARSLATFREKARPTGPHKRSANGKDEKLGSLLTKENTWCIMRMQQPK